MNNPSRSTRRQFLTTLGAAAVAVPLGAVSKLSAIRDEGQKLPEFQPIATQGEWHHVRYASLVTFYAAGLISLMHEPVNWRQMRNTNYKPRRSMTVESLMADGSVLLDHFIYDSVSIADRRPRVCHYHGAIWTREEQIDPSILGGRRIIVPRHVKADDLTVERTDWPKDKWVDSPAALQVKYVVGWKTLIDRSRRWEQAYS